MKPENLTIETLEKALDAPAQKWHGQCSAIAHAAVDVLENGHYIYGDYVGHMDKDGYWAGRAAMGGTHHAWVLLGDGRVLDPTRWSFENVEPYIYIGSDEDYDEGGNQMRAAFRRPCPSAEDGPLANLKDVFGSAPLFERMTKTPFEEMTRDQACWVANMPYDELDFAVASIYETLIANKMGVYIPIDNRKRAIREGRIKEDD